jgi:hypothetical protein
MKLTITATTPAVTLSIPCGSLIHCTQCGGIVICDQSMQADEGIVVSRGFCKKCLAITEITQRVVGKADWYEPPTPAGPNGTH